MRKGVELIEKINSADDKFIQYPKLDGYHASILKEYVKSNDGIEVAEGSFGNACKGLKYLINPKYECFEYNCLSKILAVGKVQSGKTSFFTSFISLAFDNGYNLCYLIGGTKNTLKLQNYDRAYEYFKNDEKVKLFDVNSTDYAEIKKNISKGNKVILVVLKNASENSNLGLAQVYAHRLYDVPSIVVDDEGDEYTPGAPKLFEKTHRIGANHDAIQDILSSIKYCTYLSVTATPQANFLISTIDSVSPDYAILVEPGKGYTGCNSFHDTIDNPHVINISDTDDFKESIPDSFKKAFNFYIFACCLRRSKGDFEPYSMLVHPSSYTKVQRSVVSKIRSYMLDMISILSDKNNFAYEDTIKEITNEINSYYVMNSERERDIDSSKIEECINSVVNNIECFEFNISKSGKDDIEREKSSKKLYKVYVGGNMLGRGLTLKNLCVTYIYRDSRIQAVDTLYQRARWLGYKKRYFDICRVYMTAQLKEKFLVVGENEKDTWDALDLYLSLHNDVKSFPRVFSLPDPEGKMILTRKSISKTVVLERINPGFTYDKSIWFSEDDKALNKKLYNEYKSRHMEDAESKCFSTNAYQTHLVINTTFIDFYNEFLSKYKLPRGSKFGFKGFDKIIKQIESGEMSNELKVLIMRYKTNEQRTPSIDGKTIKELPQSYNEDTEYDGDKYLKEYQNKMHFQIHLVYTDNDKPNEIMPLLCFNNPMSKKSITYVTGDNYYGTI